MDVDVGTLTIYPSVRPDGRHERRWKLVNMTGHDWTGMWITTGPQAWHGPVTDPFGGKGDPPSLDLVGLRYLGGSYAYGDEGEDFQHAFRQPITANELLRTNIVFDDGFEEFEWIELTFTYTEDGQADIPIEGRREIGSPRPGPDVGPAGELLLGLPGSASSLIGRSERPATAAELVAAHLGKELRRLRKDVAALRRRVKL